MIKFKGRRRERRKIQQVKGYYRRSADIMRKLREATGLTQEEFGELINYSSQPTISMWETGDHAPEPENYDAIIALGITHGMKISKEDLK